MSRPEDAFGHPRLVVGDRVVCEHGGPGTYLGTKHNAFAVRLDDAEMTWAHPHMVKRIGPEHGDAIVSAVERCADVLTGEEVLAIRAALPLVANEWRRRGTTHHTRAWDGSLGIAAEVSPPTEDDSTWLSWVDGVGDAEHASEAEALADADTRLRARGVALCGEVFK